MACGDAPIVTTSGLSGPKLLRRFFMAAFDDWDAKPLGESCHEGEVW